VNLSGRGDKDVDTAARWFGLLSASDVVRSDQVRARSSVAGAQGSGA